MCSYNYTRYPSSTTSAWRNSLYKYNCLWPTVANMQWQKKQRNSHSFGMRASLRSCLHGILFLYNSVPHFFRSLPQNIFFFRINICLMIFCQIKSWLFFNIHLYILCLYNKFQLFYSIKLYMTWWNRQASIIKSLMAALRRHVSCVWEWLESNPGFECDWIPLTSKPTTRRGRWLFTQAQS